MRYYNHSHLLYKKGFSIIINQWGNPIQESTCYYFDYDQRKSSINMEFPHLHSFYEMMILLSPKAKHYIAGIPYDIVSNDIVLLPPAVLHQSEYYPGEPSDRIIINFMYPQSELQNNPVYSQLLSLFDTPVPVFRFNEIDQQRLFHSLNDIVRIAEQDVPLQIREFMIHNKFEEFLFDFWSLRDQNIYATSHSNNPLEERIHMITNYIHLHYNQKLSLSSLAEHFYISNCYLSHQFKEVTGYTVNEYIQLTRTRNVQYLLSNSRDTISNIALQAGFTSFSQFNRVFRKICQMSPSEYQKQAFNTPYQISSWNSPKKED